MEAEGRRCREVGVSRDQWIAPELNDIFILLKSLILLFTCFIFQHKIIYKFVCIGAIWTGFQFTITCEE